MHHALMRQHLTNMTAPQVKVCTLALAEYDEVAQRAALLEVENTALVRQLADMVLAKAKSEPQPMRRSRPPARVNGNGTHR